MHVHVAESGNVEILLGVSCYWCAKWVVINKPAPYGSDFFGVSYVSSH